VLGILFAQNDLQVVSGLYFFLENFVSKVTSMHALVTGVSGVASFNTIDEQLQ